MGKDSQTPEKRKRKFVPRGPPPQPPTRRSPRTTTDEDEQAARMLANRLAIGQRKSKPEKKNLAASTEVALQPTSQSFSLRSFGVPEDDGKHSESDQKGSQPDHVLPSATAENDGEENHPFSDGDDLVPKTQKDYIEPWDHRNSNCPIVLPLREPPCGDPELLDKEEFGEVARHPDYDESTINSAKELGLTLEESGKEKMFFFKIPETLPVMQQSKNTNDNDNNGNRSVSEGYSIRNNPFEGLPAGPMGKILVYKSGKVKWKLGDVLFDVSPGPSTNFTNDVAVINTRERHCCVVGSPAKFVTVIPDIDLP